MAHRPVHERALQALGGGIDAYAFLHGHEHDLLRLGPLRFGDLDVVAERRSRVVPYDAVDADDVQVHVRWERAPHDGCRGAPPADLDDVAVGHPYFLYVALVDPRDAP